MKHLLLLVALIASAETLVAQELIKMVDVNAVSDAVHETLPFDRPIILKYNTKEAIQIEYIGLVKIKKKDVQAYYNQVITNQGIFVPTTSGNYPSEQLTVSQTVLTTGESKFQLNISIPPLSPNTFYDIVLLRWPTESEAELYVQLFQEYFNAGDRITPKFQLKLNEICEAKKPFHERDPTDILSLYATTYKVYYTRMSGLAGDPLAKERLALRSAIQLDRSSDSDGARRFIFAQSLRMSTIPMSFDTRTTFTITPDFGYVYYGYQEDFQGLAPYLGAQIEFRYFDKNIPFRLIANKTLLHYLSFTTGITLTSLKKDNRRDDFFSGKSMLVGLGFRLSNAVRLTGGAIGFYKEDPNPFLDRKKLAFTPFVGISIDLRLKSIIGDLTTLIPTNKK